MLEEPLPDGRGSVMWHKLKSSHAMRALPSRDREGAVLLLSLLAGLSLSAQDWPQWRGPARDGVLPSASVLREWPRSAKLVWKTAIGGGYSSPVAAQGALYVIAREAENEVVSRLDWKTGKVAWKK